jgi:hypothetical protein
MYTKWLYNLLNCRKIYQMTIKNSKHFKSKDPLKYTPIVIIGMKIYHLATLAKTVKFSARIILSNSACISACQ